MYIPISEMRNVGTLLDIDIIGSARELKELIEKQQEAMQGTEDIDPGFSVTGPEQPAGAKTDGKRKGGQR